MKTLLASAANHGLRLADAGRLVPWCEVVLVVEEAAYSVSAGGRVCGERRAEAVRVVCGVGQLRELREQLGEWIGVMEGLEGKCNADVAGCVERCGGVEL